jgi:hypothetical protein
MTATMLQKLGYGAGAVLLVALISSGVTTSCIQGRANRGRDEALAQASTLQGQVDVLTVQNQAKDKEIVGHDKTISALTDEVSRAKALVAKIRAGAPAIPPIPGHPILPGGVDGSGDDGSLVASLDALVASQDRLISELKIQGDLKSERIRKTDEALALETKRADIAVKTLKAMPASPKWDAALLYGTDEKGVTCYGVTASRSFGSVSAHVVVIPGRLYGAGIGIRF